MPTDCSDVVVAVVTRNRCNLLRDVLAELTSWDRVGGIVVVDNASEDGTADLVRSEHQEAFMIQNPVNTGATGGRNAGLDFAQRNGFKYVFLAEDDTVPTRQALDACREAAEVFPHAAMVGTSGGVFRCGFVRWNHYRPLTDRVDSCDFVHLDSCLVSVEHLRRVGYLRSDYFIMFEEPELGWRIRRQGWEIIRVRQEVQRRHMGAQSSSGGYPWRSYYQSRNYMRFVIEAREPRMWLGFAARHMHQFSRELVYPGNRTSAKFRVRGLLDGAHGRMGCRVDPP